jgi:hypothetical protein
MPWSQDVVISVLFPYFLPSIPIFKNEYWSNQDIRHVLEELMMFYSCTPWERTRDSLETFIRRMLSISAHCERNLDDDLCFLSDIEKRCSFKQFGMWRSSVYCLYACSFLIEHKVDIHEDNNYALRCASEKGYKEVLDLLLRNKADVHAKNDCALKWASYDCHKDTVTLLLEHKADVHAQHDYALRRASANGCKDIVNLLLEHKADIHAAGDQALLLASEFGKRDVVALLLEYKADVHADNDSALRNARHKDIITLLIEHKGQY